LPGPFDLNLAPLRNYYWFAALLVLASAGLLHRLSRSPLGLALRAIRENAERAEVSGIRVRRTIFLAFALAGAVPGLAGGLLGAAEALLLRRPWRSGPRTPAAARQDAA